MSTKQFRIGVDLDDVLFGTADMIATVYNDLYGTHITGSDAHGTDLEPWGGVSDTEALSRVVKIISSDRYTNEVKVLPGSRDVLRRLKDQGCTLFAITGRPESIRLQTVTTLDKLFHGIFDEKSLFFTDFYGHDGEKVTKSSLVKELKLTHFIDDQIENVKAAASVGIKTVLFGDYSWNRDGALREGVIRLIDWAEVEKYLDD